MGSDKRKPVAERLNGNFWRVPVDLDDMDSEQNPEFIRSVSCPRGLDVTCKDCLQLRLFVTNEDLAPPYTLCSPFHVHDLLVRTMDDDTSLLVLGEEIIAASTEISPYSYSAAFKTYLFTKAFTPHH